MTNGIRFFTKTETDGTQTVRIEVPEDVTLEDLESAWESVRDWHVERSVKRGKFFSQIVRDQSQFDNQVHKLFQRGYSWSQIAWTADAELFEMLRQHQAEWDALDLKADSEGVFRLESLSSFYGWLHAYQWLQRVYSILEASRPGWTAEKRWQEIIDAQEKIKLGTAKRECLIDRETIRRSLDRWSERHEGKVSPRRRGRKRRKLR